MSFARFAWILRNNRVIHQIVRRSALHIRNYRQIIPDAGNLVVEKAYILHPVECAVSDGSGQDNTF